MGGIVQLRSRLLLSLLATLAQIAPGLPDAAKEQALVASTP